VHENIKPKFDEVLSKATALYFLIFKKSSAPDERVILHASLICSPKRTRMNDNLLSASEGCLDDSVLASSAPVERVFHMLVWFAAQREQE
jgi:hypothetical protein